eukprot:6946948-Pyramimonas_sp.AAC.1
MRYFLETGPISGTQSRVTSYTTYEAGPRGFAGGSQGVSAHQIAFRICFRSPPNILQMVGTASPKVSSCSDTPITGGANASDHSIRCPRIRNVNTISQLKQELEGQLYQPTSPKRYSLARPLLALPTS